MQERGGRRALAQRTRTHPSVPAFALVFNTLHYGHARVSAFGAVRRHHRRLHLREHGGLRDRGGLEHRDDGGRQGGRGGNGRDGDDDGSHLHDVRGDGLARRQARHSDGEGLAHTEAVAGARDEMRGRGAAGQWRGKRREGGVELGGETQGAGDPRHVTSPPSVSELSTPRRLPLPPRKTSTTCASTLRHKPYFIS
ncbi:hypothetical protein OF83DRAFT_937396 [Amylostereum chailletii]|nr:hypothetical protein OF83DRAFT_937396 [Amylostereum chailletii]